MRTCVYVEDIVRAVRARGLAVLGRLTGQRALEESPQLKVLTSESHTVYGGAVPLVCFSCLSSKVPSSQGQVWVSPGVGGGHV